MYYTTFLVILYILMSHPVRGLEWNAQNQINLYSNLIQVPLTHVTNHWKVKGAAQISIIWFDHLSRKRLSYWNIDWFDFVPSVQYTWVNRFIGLLYGTIVQCLAIAHAVKGFWVKFLLIVFLTFLRDGKNILQMLWTSLRVQIIDIWILTKLI